MESRWRAVLAVTAAAALAGCGTPAADPQEAEPAQPIQARVSWALQHRVVESRDIQVVGTSISHYEEATSVTVAPGAKGVPDRCSVTLSAQGQGGPERMVGEQRPARVQGRPGVRSGAGAESSYLMWQLEDERWVLVTCDPLDEQRAVNAVAKAVQLGKSSLRLPFALDALPSGYGVGLISQDLERGSTSVYVGPHRPEFGHAEADLEISFETSEPRHEPSGRSITVAGRPALLDEEPRHPEVCVLLHERFVCVSTLSSDTGPYPDRSAEVPVLLSLAEGLSFPRDLDDRSTWFAAERVFA